MDYTRFFGHSNGCIKGLELASSVGTFEKITDVLDRFIALFNLLMP